MMEQTVVTIKFDFLGDKAEAINKSLRLIHREMDKGSIIGGTIAGVGSTYTYDVKKVPAPAATDVKTKDGN